MISLKVYDVKTLEGEEFSLRFSFVISEYHRETNPMLVRFTVDTLKIETRPKRIRWTKNLGLPNVRQNL